MPFDNAYSYPSPDVALLMDARSRILCRASWVQGCLQEGNRRCLIGALSLACGSRSFVIPNKTEQRLARLIATQIPPNAPFVLRLELIPARRRLMWFNDAPSTRHEDVMKLFDRSIQSLTAEVPAYVSA